MLVKSLIKIIIIFLICFPAFGSPEQSDSNKSQKLVSDVYWTPYKLFFNKGESITLQVLTNDEKEIHKLEFEVLRYKNNQWDVLIPWRPWPIKITFNSQELYTLQVNVRKHNSNNPMQLIFLGQMYVGATTSHPDYLIRQILAHHTNIQASNLIIAQSVAQELYAGFQLLTDKKLSAKTEKLLTKDGVTLYVNPKSKTISDGFVSIAFNLKQHPYIQQVLQQTKNLPPKIQFAAVLTYLLTSNNLYAPASTDVLLKRPWSGIRSTYGFCNIDALLEKKMLNALGYNVKTFFVMYQNDATHALAEIEVNGKYYLIDPTNNSMGYGYPSSFVVRKNYGEFYHFPYVRKFQDLYSVPIKFIHKIGDIYLSGFDPF